VEAPIGGRGGHQCGGGRGGGVGQHDAGGTWARWHRGLDLGLHKAQSGPRLVRVGALLVADAEDKGRRRFGGAAGCCGMGMLEVRV
jgi:hypothetical protein